MDEVEVGRSVHMDDIILVLQRHGHLEETHFAFSYTPIRDGARKVAGIVSPFHHGLRRERDPCSWRLGTGDGNDHEAVRGRGLGDQGEGHDPRRQ